MQKGGFGYKVIATLTRARSLQVLYFKTQIELRTKKKNISSLHHLFTNGFDLKRNNNNEGFDDKEE